MTDPPEQDQFGDAMAAIWTRSRPQLLERQATIANAVSELESRPDDVALRESARTEAHKLAGLLGTLGLPTGTDLARAIEHRLDPDAPVLNIAELRQLAADLRAVIESKQ
jgi:HPt (histidine-containing phosphotransfer) domain-containing protein